MQRGFGDAWPDLWADYCEQKAKTIGSGKLKFKECAARSKSAMEIKKAFGSG